MISKIKLEELTLDDIGQWPLIIKVIAVVFINGLFVLGLYNYDLQSHWQQLNMLQQENTNLQLNLTHQKQQLNQRVFHENKLRSLQKLWTSKTQQLVNSNHIADLLADITRIGIANGLQFKSVRPLSEKNQENVMILPVTIQVEGEYPQLVQFLLQLAVFKHYISLQAFTLTKVEVNSKLALDLILNIYRADNTIGLKDSSATASLARKNPFQTEIDTESEQSLTTFAIDALQMVGSLQQGSRQWALLSAPNGYVYRVMVGEEVGHHHGKVKAISADKIEISEQEMGENKSLVLQLHK